MCVYFRMRQYGVSSNQLKLIAKDSDTIERCIEDRREADIRQIDARHETGFASE